MGRLAGRWARQLAGVVLAVTTIVSLTMVGIVTTASAATPARTPRAVPHLHPALTAKDLANYWEVASDGGIFTEGKARFYGSTGALNLNKPIVDMAATPDGKGYWMVASDGGIFNFGDAKFYGSTGAINLNKPIVAMAPTSDAKGYWLVASDGGIFSFGDAKFLGSTGAITLNKPIVGMAPTPTGAGYWLVASDGGIFSFGDAKFFGSTGAITLNKPIVAMAATLDGAGYYMVASDGGIFSFGDAKFYGSTGAITLNKPIVGMTVTPTGHGYWLVASDGGIFNFGDAAFNGSTGGLHLNKPIVAMATILDNIGPNTVVIPAGDTLSVDGGGGGPQVITLAPNAPTVIPGQILVSGITTGAPAGYLVKVVSVTTNGAGDQVVSALPAKLTDAISTGTTEGAATLQNAGPGPASRLAWGPYGGATPQLAPRGDDPCSGQTLCQQIGDLPLKCAATGHSTTVNGSVGFSPNFLWGIDISWGLTHPIPTVNFLSAGVSLNEGVTFSMTGDAGAECDTSGQDSSTTVPDKPSEGIDLFGDGIDLPPITFAIGPVPVVIEPVVHLYLNGYVSVSVGFTASLTQHFFGAAGMTYANGGFHPFSTTGGSPCMTFFGLSCPPSPSFNASLNITDGTAQAAVSLTAGLDMLFYYIAGPSVDLGAEADYSTTIGGNPPPNPWWQVNGCLYGGIAFVAPVLDINWGDPTLLKLCTRIAQSSPGTPTPPPMTITSPSSFFATQGDSFTTGTPSTANGTATGWSVSSGSLPAGLSINGTTGVISGTPTATGPVTFTLQATGPGSPATLSVTIDVLSAMGSVQSIASADNTYCALQLNGSVDCWGKTAQNAWPSAGFVCIGSAATAAPVCSVPGVGPSPSAFVSSATPAVSLAGDDANDGFCAVLTSGGVDCWGSNSNGQLGDGSGTAIAATAIQAVTVQGLTTAAQVVAGDQSYCALLSGGGVDCWGSNADGQLGDGTATAVGSNATTPVPVTGISNAVSVTTDGTGTYCAVLATGTVDCWGNDGNGELGDNGSSSSSTPVAIPNVSNATMVASDPWPNEQFPGAFCAVLTSGGVVCWGSNTDGELGAGLTTSESGPVPVHSISSHVTGLSGGYGTFCAALSTGGVDCWGNNWDGQLGDGSATTMGGSSNIPVPVSGITSATSVAANENGFCATIASGSTQSVDCWGDGGYGQLGNGSSSLVPSSTPVGVALSSGTSVSSITSDGTGSVCAVTTQGAALCWGNDANGQLGDGGTTNRSSAEAVQAPGIWSPPPT